MTTDSGPAPEIPGSPFRLVIIPLLIYGAWVLDTFLLEGSLGVFARYQPVTLILYTVVANILIGIIVPVACLPRALFSGAVNMFQLGIRSLRRTVIVVSITAAAGYLVLVTITPFGTQRSALIGTFLLVLPAAVAGVIVIWVLAGTHLQAFVRQNGAAVSIALGVICTGILFTGSCAGHNLLTFQPGALMLLLGAGTASAIFFFSVRDIWASVVFQSLALAVILQGRVDPSYLTTPGLLFVISGAAASVLSLAAGQMYLSRRFITVRIMVETSEQKGR